MAELNLSKYGITDVKEIIHNAIYNRFNLVPRFRMSHRTNLMLSFSLSLITFFIFYIILIFFWRY